jgi:hypothetical protein
MTAIAFDTTGILYAAFRNGSIYSVNLMTKSMTMICSTKVQLTSISFDSQTNELWGTPYVVIGSNKDLLFKINTTTGDTTRIGKTGMNIMTNCLTFDNLGNLYGVTGSTGVSNNFISINKSTGAAATIGSIGLSHITGLTYSSPGPAAVNSETVLPKTFSLSQNYPNPFNPVTTINYSVAKEGRVKLTVYNSIGIKVATIVNENKPAGHYSVQFNGSSLASGIYLYRLESGNFSADKKLILLK